MLWEVASGRAEEIPAQGLNGKVILQMVTFFLCPFLPVLAEVDLVMGFLTSTLSPASPSQGGLCTGQGGKQRPSLRLVGLARQLREVNEQWS